MIRGSALLLPLLAAACSTDLERGRYQCIPEGPAEQCPGSSRCGLEGYCHNAGDVSVAWQCVDRNHCENGYECVLADSRAFRECRDATVDDAGFACAVSTDCVRGWRCGRSFRCHDPKVAAPYACKSDLDCEQLWRCGLDGLCLDPTRDALRPVTTALGNAAKVSPLLLDHPPERLAVSPVQTAGFNQPRQFIAWFDQGDIQVLDLLVGGTPPVGSNPHRLQTMPDAGEITSLATLGALSLDKFAQPDIGSWTYVTRPGGKLEELHFRTTVNAQFGFNGTPWREVLEALNDNPVSDFLSPDALRVGTTEPGYVPTLNAFQRTQAAPPYQYFYGWGAWSRAQFQNVEPNEADVPYFTTAVGFPGNVVLDMATVTGHYFDVATNTVGQTDCVLFADDRGLYVHQVRIENTFTRRYRPWPLLVPPFTHAECAEPDENDVPQSHRITGLSTAGRDWVVVRANPLDLDAGVPITSEEQVALIDVSSWWDLRNEPGFVFTKYRGCGLDDESGKCKKGGSFADPVYPVKASTVLGPCRVCENERLVMVAPVPNGLGGMKLEVRCRADVDGGSPVDRVLDVSSAPGMGAACFRAPHPMTGALATDPVFLSASSSGQYAFAGPRGHLWAGNSAATAVPVFLDQPPAAVFAGPTGAPTFFGVDRVAWPATGYGLIAFQLSPKDGDRPVAPVASDPRAFLTAGASVLSFDAVAAGGLPRTLVPRDPLTTRFDPPFHAIAANRYVVASAGDAVFAANLDAPNRALRRRIVPAEGKEILGLVHLPRAGPLTVHALTRSAVYRITAVSEQQWTSEAAALPAGEPIALWADGDRGRIGYADGRVFALETLVQIGAALPEPVDAFAHVCGQPYALAGGVVSRLVAGAEAIGDWKPIAIAGAPSAAELDDGTLLPFREADAGTALYVFSRRGEALRAPVTGCQ